MINGGYQTNRFRSFQHRQASDSVVQMGYRVIYGIVPFSEIYIVSLSMLALAADSRARSRVGQLFMALGNPRLRCFVGS